MCKQQDADKLRWVLYRYGKCQDWYLINSQFDDAMDYSTLPSHLRVQVMNRGDEPLTVDGISLAPGVWQEIPLFVIKKNQTRCNIRVDLTSAEPYLLRRTADNRPIIDWWCAVSALEGYGRQSLDIWRGLKQKGVEANLRATQRSDSIHLDTNIVAEARRPKAPARVAVTMAMPNDPALIDNPSPVKISITQFETNHVPEKYVELINTTDHLIVTSRFQIETWRNSGLTIPISVMTPGIDTTWFSYMKRNRTKEFKVLILGALSRRKNAEAGIRIFQEASQGSSTWRLTIKSRRVAPDPLLALANQDDRITLLFEDMSPQNIQHLYHTHDCFLWTSNGEGVGLPPLEAMATGMEVVSACHSGMLDFISSGWAWPIRTARLVPADAEGQNFSEHYVSVYGSVGAYWQPDEAHGVEQLQNCYSAWRAGKGKGDLAAEYVRANHTLRHQTESVWKVVQSYV